MRACDWGRGLNSRHPNPPDRRVAYDNVDKTDEVVYKTAFVDNVCNNRAAVVDQRTIKIVRWTRRGRCGG